MAVFAPSFSPRPPDAGDVMQKRLFEDRYAVYYAAAVRNAPANLAAYLAAEHVTVVYEPRWPLDLDRVLADRGVARRFVASVPGFAAVGAFVRGTPWLATAPSLLSGASLRGLAMALPPLACPPLPMFLIWHLRHQADPLQMWLRAAIERGVAPALAAARAGSVLAEAPPAAGVPAT